MRNIFEFFKRSPRVNVDAMMESALSLIDSGNREQACEVLEKLVEAEPKFGPAWHWLGATLIHTGNLARARHALEEAKRLSPHNERIHDSMRMLEQLEENAAIAQRLGGWTTVGGKPVKSGEAVERKIRQLDAAERDPTTPICRICKKSFRILDDRPVDSQTGVRCERCSTFYCASCLNNMLRCTAVIACLGCKASRVHRSDTENELRYDGFKVTYYKTA